MQKNRIQKILIPVQVVWFIFQIVSGLLPDVIPYQVHQVSGLLLGAGIGLHVILNWSWIRANYFKRKVSSTRSNA